MKSSDIFGMFFLVFVLNIIHTLSADIVEVYEGFSYTFVMTLRTFNASEEDCVSRGGHLASVHSQEEFNFIQGVFEKNSFRNMWVGLYTNEQIPHGGEAARSTWSWTDGSTMNFTDGWEKGEPNVEEVCARHRKVPNSNEDDDNAWAGNPDGFTTNYGYICKSVNGGISSATTTSLPDGPPTSGSGGESSSTGVIVGALVAVVIIAAVVVVVVILLMRRKKKKNRTKNWKNSNPAVYANQLASGGESESYYNLKSIPTLPDVVTDQRNPDLTYSTVVVDEQQTHNNRPDSTYSESIMPPTKPATTSPEVKNAPAEIRLKPPKTKKPNKLKRASTGMDDKKGTRDKLKDLYATVTKTRRTNPTSEVAPPRKTANTETLESSSEEEAEVPDIPEVGSRGEWKKPSVKPKPKKSKP